MKTIISLILAAISSAVCLATTQDTPSAFSGFSLGSRSAERLPESFYNPFKVSGHQAMTPVSAQTDLPNEEVARLIGDHNVQGLIFAADNVTGEKAIIGDAVFSIGDEIAFYNADNVLVRLAPSGSVRLVKIRHDYLELEISVAGKPSRTMDYSLSTFSTP